MAAPTPPGLVNPRSAEQGRWTEVGRHIIAASCAAMDELRNSAGWLPRC